MTKMTPTMGLSLMALLTTLFAPTAQAAPATPVMLGIDVLLSERIDLVTSRKIGLITNASAVDGQLVPTLDRLRDDPRVNVVQLYAPEHGLGGALNNGRSDRKGREARTELPIEGLFGRQNRPSPPSLARIDLLVFDIQDIGSRTYTYISTLGNAMQAAKAAGKPIMVLDRPNPLGGLLFEGPIRAPKYKSLIGWGPLPVTHGMTVGEIARFYNEELGIGAELIVVPMKGWKRSMVWADTGLTWVPTSPGIPHELNAHFYVATGMVGGSGTDINEGGGNSMPFELIGAPWIDGHALAAELAKAGLPGVRFRPFTYIPARGQYAKKVVDGVQLILDDARTFLPLRTALTILVAIQKLHPEDLEVKDPQRFGRVWGNDRVLQQIRKGWSALRIEEDWQEELKAFGERRSRHLIYD